MTKAAGQTKPSAYKTALDIIKILRRELLAAESGTYIGSVEDLMARFGISRSTLRQAVRVLEHEQLLVAKRGNAGGFYGTRPRIDSVVATTATYLYSHKTTIWDFIAVASGLNREMARLAALSTNKSLRRELMDMLDASWRVDFSSAEEMMRADYALEKLLTKMAKNHVIELFMRITYQFGLQTIPREAWMTQEAQVTAWRKERLFLGEAILKGDSPLAMKVAERHYKIISPWLLEAERTLKSRTMK